MSIKAVKDFYEKIASDEDFQRKLDELQNEATEGLELPLAQDKKEEIVKDVIIPFAKEQGFDFSIEDIKEFEQSIIEQLDEKQLENLNAGVGIGSITCKIIGFGIGGIYSRYDGHSLGGMCILIGFGTGYGTCLVGGLSSTLI